MQVNDGSARSDIFVSVITAIDAHTADPAALAGSLVEDLLTRYSNVEVLLVDNGIGNVALTGLRDALAEVPCLRVIRLAQPVGDDAALLAGIDLAIGDVAVTIDLTTDDPSHIHEIVDLVREGADIVQGVDIGPSSHARPYQFARRAFYWYNRRFVGTPIPTNATYLIGLSRRAINTVADVTSSHRWIRHLIHRVGYRIVDFPYRPGPPSRHRRSMRSKLAEAVETITSHSVHPLRVVTVVGLIGASANLAYAVYVVVLNLIGPVREGWTTTSLQLSVMFIVVCVMLAVQSEYMGRILTESRRDAPYVVMEEIESRSQIADRNRRNVRR